MAIDATPTTRSVTAQSTLAETLEHAMATEFQAFKGQPLPSAGTEDRQMLFNAIAMGIVAYFKAHEGDFNVKWSPDSDRPSEAPSHVTIEVTW